jgi:glycosyltransferase involved in cell wall biosynthesis
MAVRPGPYCEEAIASILAQTYEDFELIAINNGGGAETRKVLESFNDSRIIILENAEDIGLTKALNQGLGVARGVYVARMDDDDISQRERFVRQKEFLDMHPDIAVVGSALQVIGERGEPLGIKRHPSYPPLLAFKLVVANQLAHSSVMFRKDIVLNAGGYNEEFRYAQDYELWSRLAQKGFLLSNLEEPLLKLRIHGASVSSGPTQSSAYSFGKKIIAENIARYMEFSEKDFKYLTESLHKNSVKSTAALRSVILFWRHFEQNYFKKEKLSPTDKKIIKTYISKEKRRTYFQFVRCLRNRFI